jgi:hypothetical protein
MVRGDAWFSGYYKDARWHVEPLHKLSNIHVPARPANGNPLHTAILGRSGLCLRVGKCACGKRNATAIDEHPYP